jgi:AbrB family looped-hinge helix DNA binding protein
MRATGIIRRIDDLGRIVIHKEVRRQMRISTGDALEIYTDRDGCVIFKKYVNDELKPMGEGIVKALAKNGINASVYNTYGDKIAGNGVEEIDLDLEDDCLFPINATEDTLGYVSVDVYPGIEDKVIIEATITLASAYLDEDI